MCVRRMVFVLIIYTHQSNSYAEDLKLNRPCDGVCVRCHCHGAHYLLPRFRPNTHIYIYSQRTTHSTKPLSVEVITYIKIASHICPKRTLKTQKKRERPLSLRSIWFKFYLSTIWWLFYGHKRCGVLAHGTRM